MAGKSTAKPSKTTKSTKTATHSNPVPSSTHRHIPSATISVKPTTHSILHDHTGSRTLPHLHPATSAAVHCSASIAKSSKTTPHSHAAAATPTYSVAEKHPIKVKNKNGVVEAETSANGNSVENGSFIGENLIKKFEVIKDVDLSKHINDVEGGNRSIYEFSAKEVTYESDVVEKANKIEVATPIVVKVTEPVESEVYPDPEEIAINLEENKKKFSLFVAVPNSIWKMTPIVLKKNLTNFTPKRIQLLLEKNFSENLDDSKEKIVEGKINYENHDVRKIDFGDIPPIYRVAGFCLLLPALVVLWPLVAGGYLVNHYAPETVKRIYDKVVGERILHVQNE
ncbi:hypothetical protein HDU92_002514 [Lobulomyces angularis]|nr:hypothetical protein HDU92_002514 [Lobulomyces angularis]